MNILAIDDYKPHSGATKVVRTFDEGIKALSEQKWDELWLDWDLGTDPHTGFDVLAWLAKNQQHLPGKIIPVSGSPGACQMMSKRIRNLYLALKPKE